MSKNPSAKPIDIKISTVVAVSAILRETDPAVLGAAIREVTGGDPEYFEGEFVVLDFGDADLSGGAVDWEALIALFRSHRLNPVAVRHVPAALEAQAIAHGLTVEVVAKPRPETAAVPAAAPVPAPAPAPVPAPAQAAPAAPAATPSSMIIDTPVRGGQRVYARGCDLVVMAAVNPGAEIIADGSIHVYAPLRGRALAGASGNTEARIFALAMEPELVSIAGMYRTFEGGMPKEQAGKPAQIRLIGDKLDIGLIPPAR